MIYHLRSSTNTHVKVEFGVNLQSLLILLTFIIRPNWQSFFGKSPGRYPVCNIIKVGNKLYYLIVLFLMINCESIKIFELMCKSHAKVKWCTLGPWGDSQPVTTKVILRSTDRRNIRK